MDLIKQKIDEILIFLCLFILGFNFIAFSAFTQEEGDGILLKSVLRFSVIGFLLIIIYIKRRVHAFYILSLPVIFILYIINGNIFTLNFLYLVLFVCALQNYDQSKLLENIFYVYLFMAIYHLVFLKFGYISNTYVEYGGRFRANYGFGNFNKLGMLYFYYGLICVYYLINKTSILNKFIALFGFVVSLFFIVASDSRTSLICFIIAIVFYFLNKVVFFSKIIKLYFKFIFIFCFLLTLFLSSTFGIYFNDILSTRPELFNKYLLDFNFVPSLFFGYFGEPDYPVDNSYLVLLGAIGPVLIFPFILISPFLIKSNQIPISQIPILIGLIFFGVFENSLLRIELLLPILLFYYLLPGYKKTI